MPIQASSIRIGKPKACVQCRARKVKCDRNSTCSNCSAWSLKCIYPSPIRMCKRRLKVSSSPLAEADISGSLSVNERVQQLETAFHHLTGRIEGQLAAPPSEHDRAIDINTDCQERIPGNSQAIEVLKPAPALPSLQLAQVCWPTFLQTIDPLIKVLHRQHTETIIRRASNQKSSLSKGEQALLFVICFSSIFSMTTVEADACFNIPKGTALAAYRSASEQTLMEASFFATEDLVTLQALVLFLSFARFMNEAKLGWALTGLAARLSCSPGLGISHFEKELRKRLQWELWYLDHRATEDHGRDYNATVSIVDTEMPLNIMDSDLDPDMVVHPSPRHEWTAISFSLIRFEIAIVTRKIESNLPLYQKDKMIDECENKIQNKYLRHCKRSESMHWLAHHVSHVLIMEIRFKLYSRLDNSNKALPHAEATRHRLFLAAIDIVDVSSHLEMQPDAQKWKWLLSAYLQYVPLAFLLAELCHRENCELVDRAWRVVERAMLRWAGELERSKHGRILTQLMSKARGQRDKFKEIQFVEPFVPGHNMFNFSNGRPGTAADLFKESDLYSINDIETFTFDNAVPNSLEQLSFNGDPLRGSTSAIIADFAPSEFNPSYWSNEASSLGDLDGSFAGTALSYLAP